MKKVACYSYRLEPPSANPQGEVKLTQLVRWLLEAATKHAELWKVGYSSLLVDNHAWVLARLGVEMESYPLIYEDVVIETWIEDFNPHFSNRNFCIKRADGKIYGYARSIWSVIDMKTRASVDLHSLGDIAQYVSDKECPISRLSKLKSVTVESPRLYRVGFTDLDLNRHMNSLKYIDRMLDLYPLERYDQNRVARFEINYIQETLDKAQLQIHHRPLNENEEAVEIKNSESVALCRGKVIFLSRKESN